MVSDFANAYSRSLQRLDPADAEIVVSDAGGGHDRKATSSSETIDRFVVGADGTVVEAMK
jgi:hypothetical protein